MTAKKPYGRSLSDFLPLKPGEKRLLDACREGLPAKLGDVVPESATNENSLRADFLRFLLLGGDKHAPVHEKGVNLFGAFVEGFLDFGGCHIKLSVILRSCRFDQLIHAIDARLDGALHMNGSYLEEGFLADRIYCLGGIFFSNRFISKGQISLAGAQIRGHLSLRNSQIEFDGGNALCADRANIQDSVLLDSGFKVTGIVSLVGATIGGDLNCCDGNFIVPGDIALSAQSANILGNVFLGVVDWGVLKGESADKNASTLGRKNFMATGTFWLIGAQIGGDLDCRGGEFKADDIALLADRSQIQGGVYLVEGFSTTGEVRLVGASIGGDLLCHGGRFEVTKSAALKFSDAEVKGNVNLGDSFRATGQVIMVGAEIGGDFYCNGAQFLSAEDDALCLDSAVVRGSWFFDISEQVRVKASHAEVAVLVDSIDAWAPGSRLDGFRYAAFGGIASTSGRDRIKWLFRQPESHLSGSGFCPQPWRQLQRVLREIGHAEDAKQVGIEYEKHLRKIGVIGQSAADENLVFAFWRRITAFILHYCFGLLAAYGYRPLRLLTWMLGVWLGCAGLYWLLAQQPYNSIAPSNPLVFQNANYAPCRSNELHTVQTVRVDGQGNWPSCNLMPGEYSTFSSLAYSLDLLLPVVDLGQETAWGAYIPAEDEGEPRMPFLKLPWGYAVRWLAWFEILFGWMSSLILVATISGFSRRNDEG